MGLKALAWAWDTPIHYSRKIILLALADCHNDSTGQCNPSIPYVIERSGMPRATIFKILGELEDDGLIKRKGRSRHNHKKGITVRLSSEFTLCFNAIPPKKETPTTTVDGFSVHGKGESPPGGLTGGESPPGGQCKSTRWTVIEPEGEPEGSCSASHYNGRSDERPGRLQHIHSNDSSEPPDYDSLGEAQRRKDTAKQSTTIPNTLIPVLDRWRQIGINHRQGTKALQDGVRALRRVRSGVFFDRIKGYERYRRTFTVQEILTALDGFDLRRNHPDYHPADKSFLKSLSLSSFFYSPYARNGHDGTGASVFIECMTQEPQLAADQNPDLTKLVLRLCQELNADGVSYESAARASARLHRYWTQRGDWLRERGRMLNERMLVSTWLRWLDKTRPGWGMGHILAKGMEDTFEKHLRN